MSNIEHGNTKSWAAVEGEDLPPPPAEGAAWRSGTADRPTSTAALAAMATCCLLTVLASPPASSHGSHPASRQSSSAAAQLFERLPAAGPPCLPGWFVLLPGFNSARSRGAACEGL